MIKIATLGAASSANKGAGSMLQAVIDNAPARFGPVRVSVLSTYPDSDRLEPPHPVDGAEIEIIDAKPLLLLLVLFPLGLLAWVFGHLKVPSRVFARTPALRALVDADVVVDIAGISFVDGRGLPTLVYNTLMTGLPLLLGKPTVKCSQAMGPFEQRLNRLLGRFVLSRLDVVCPRGDRTEAHVATIGLTNTMPAADLAFTMDLPADAVAEAEALLPGDGWVVVMPSSVVHRSSEKKGIDYPKLVADLVDGVTERTGKKVALVPHSSRPSDEISRMNDRPTCRMVFEQLQQPDRVVFLDQSLTPTTLRAIIARGDALATSRFHAMISALSTSTPVLVVGWSHKYAEVLREFDLEEWVLDFANLPEAGLVGRVEALLAAGPDVRAQITEHLPAVTERALVNYDAIEKGLRRP